LWGRAIGIVVLAAAVHAPVGAPSVAAPPAPACISGTLNLSVLDGWWAEACDGSNGWAIDGSEAPNAEAKDQREAQARRARGRDLRHTLDRHAGRRTAGTSPGRTVRSRSARPATTAAVMTTAGRAPAPQPVWTANGATSLTCISVMHADV
jgi:hypothetical protein